MSKCDIRITFDNPDRQFQGGDVVSGEVHIRVNKDIRCNGIILTHYWRTHGRGNTDRGEVREIRLSELLPLQAGEELDLPFEFTADCWPLTYRGHYVNVDHYVHVAVDVPWAIDPKQEEDYVLVAGVRPAEITGARGEVAEFENSATEAAGIGKMILYGFLALFAVMFSIMFFFLLPVILIAGGIFWGWRKMITSRVGDVTLKTPHLVVGPGEQWPVELSFTPKKSFPINGITLTIEAREAATSGSGTDRTTHHHTLYEDTSTLHPAGMLMAGEPFLERFAFEMPETAAWSLDESNNDIKWSAEVRIDIPRCPDWKKHVELQMLPGEFLDEVSHIVLERTNRDNNRAFEARQEHEWQDASAAASTPGHQESRGEDVTPLLRLVEDIRQAGRFGNERSEIVNGTAGHTYDVEVQIDRASPTFGFVGDDQRYENGKTIIGTLVGTDQEVQLFTIGATNDLVENRGRGEVYQTPATVEGWDSLYNRLVLHESASV